jgi:hypothetical protein
MYAMLRTAILLVTASLIIFCCDHDDLPDENAVRLEFSKDTVYFDTILVSLGSITQYFTIRNPYDGPVEISRLALARGGQSFFRLNVNGINGKEFTNIRLARKDSIFVFVEVTIDPLNENNPMLIKDSVVISVNANQQDVKLIAYGQDVHLFRSEVFKSQTWTKEKPYLIMYNAAIDSGEILTIEPGTHIYLAPLSSLHVRGSVHATGTAEEPIVFTNARFDGRYEKTAGEWNTIFIHQYSTGNKLEHVIIKNAQAGLWVGYPDDKVISSVELNNCIIRNSGSVGLVAFGSNITAYNTIIADCAGMAILIQMGGNYNFYHCTISNVSGYFPGSMFQGGYKPRGNAQPSLLYTNYYTGLSLDEDYRIVTSTYPVDLDLNFYNSIIEGVLSNEVYFETDSGAGMHYLFDHCLLKLHTDSLHNFDTNLLISPVFNADPLFTNDSIAKGEYDFSLGIGSPAVDAGNYTIIQGIPQLLFDFAGNPRSDGFPDIGAIEQSK